ncbi:MAG: hypothetical protein AAB209_01180 [Bacteroidota bacterium]
MARLKDAAEENEQIARFSKRAMVEEHRVAVWKSRIEGFHVVAESLHFE